ncbi:phospho-N-acetylmuramoyl-pentapeptide-transferase [Candidatus Azambacteria bacterium RIFCSPHIGHO2_01_FULL_44_55]|uniref:Phospho-N-acetylmuramoyl-pentapeptide-transferase n=1 Tax=Candidatus Azambacteria bacterium RIFCSPLOWO2_02_FULL_44_14 TaxID=1797306 RepID=A0A1F5CBR9_9BACT|nr:MAG: phospho-N-acetylmuramoyl-pentapeptide-transferase [Candidatus Azambacteria bacterium RIFCSPLOWO2_01_FULL_44_84]OGD33169.1 MAG: phospho-N-acetylmuramoyl-pentapeptide-transferase [Candidatus Azambacteria bacterium RIFCSPHIGHO2_02_FULL_45_18]OGD40241.1 MAG: phospho-N-acetylmuramoyl-pentapeptide-transferase [Candidatus Azambacteria bacterium RIFCSPHIGHO2_01_FULL_44_55]OGD40274.1 MAG: phospho-N-acetylmuramoyl-pentapeptide-transferase [Candidatus Azambacteria bacterium RIFCSPLOWO2_02_FULL_44_1
MAIEITQVIRLLILTSVSFVIAFLSTPILTHFLFKYRLGKQIRIEGAPVFAQIHGKKEGTPTMGGLLVWVTTVAVALIFWILSLFFDGIFTRLNFLSRAQTFLPLGILVFSAILGLLDDLLGIWKIGPKGGGLSMKQRVMLYTAVAVLGAWWFYFKLGWNILHVPFFGNVEIGFWYVPFFIFIIVATAFSTNETDGLDGLAGGTLLFAFAALGALAFAQQHYDLAAFCGVILGALLAFLWFNIYPARFFMGDTGAMSLGITLGVVAMLTNAALLLPLIAFILVFESGSVIVQMASKKFFGRKIFLSTPIHHHFEAIGWPETKVTMRFWIISAVTAVVGLIIGLLGK